MDKKDNRITELENKLYNQRSMLDELFDYLRFQTPSRGRRVESLIEQTRRVLASTKPSHYDRPSDVAGNGNFYSTCEKCDDQVYHENIQESSDGFVCSTCYESREAQEE